jgi:ubiquinone/menaquinone biosynthesis C-methylase UbiE
MTVTTENTTRTHDPYASIADLDEAVVATLADRIETRAADPHQRRLWREALSRPTYPDQATVLEVGCGTGVITAMIADLTGVAAAVGVDPSPYFVERARQRAPSLRFEVADGRSLPFDDQTFDGVVLATTLCHIPAPEQALAEAHRVLRPGGQILVYDGDYTSTTVAVSRHDPLQACVDAAIAAIVHSPWLCRRLRPLVAAAGFMSEELHSPPPG